MKRISKVGVKMPGRSAVVRNGVVVQAGRGVVYTPTPADLETVKQLTLLGATEATIADCIGDGGVAVETLRKYYLPTLRTHRTMTLAKIASQTIYQKAMPDPETGAPGDTVSAMFVLKCRAGWREQDPAMNVAAQQVVMVKRIVGVDLDDI